jgi:cobalt-zinc-cadmium efflux system membrane fusion protein
MVMPGVPPVNHGPGCAPRQGDWGHGAAGAGPRAALALTLLATLLLAGSGAAVAGEPETQGGVPAPDQAAARVKLDEKQVRHLTVVRVEKRSFRVEKSAIGQLTFNEAMTSPVFSPYSGRVVRVLVGIGDQVRRGDPLVEINTPEIVQAQTDLIAAAANLLKSRNQVELARRNAARMEDLIQVKAVAQRDYDQAAADLQAAVTDGRIATATVESARSRLRGMGKSEEDLARIETERRMDSTAVVTSPITGVAVARKVGPGQWVQPTSDAMFVISDLSTLWLKANVSEADIPHIRVGQLLEVRVMAFPDRMFKARVTNIGASVDPVTRRIPVRSELANPDLALKSEMLATFRIITAADVMAPSVPLTAVNWEGARAKVWVAIAPTEFSERIVRLGVEQDGRVQVLSGVEAGERIVSDGAVFLSSARRVSSG